jgi:hypothetical protein
MQMSYFTTFRGIAIVATVVMVLAQDSMRHAHANSLDCPDCCSDEPISAAIPDYLPLLRDLGNRALNTQVEAVASNLVSSARDSFAASGDPNDLVRFDSLRPALTGALANGIRDLWNSGLGSPFEFVLQKTSEARVPASATGPFFPPLTSVTGSLSPNFHFNAPGPSDFPAFLDPLRSGNLSRIVNDVLSRTTLDVQGKLNYGSLTASGGITLQPESEVPFATVKGFDLRLGLLHEFQVDGKTKIDVSLTADLNVERGAGGDFDKFSGGGLVTVTLTDPCNCETAFAVPGPVLGSGPVPLLAGGLLFALVALRHRWSTLVTLRGK